MEELERRALSLPAIVLSQKKQAFSKRMHGHLYYQVITGVGRKEGSWSAVPLVPTAVIDCIHDYERA